MASLKRISFTDEQFGQKVNLEDMLDKLFGETIQKARGRTRGKTRCEVGGPLAKFTKALVPINKRLGNLKRVSRTAHSAPPVLFVPSFVETKGFVDDFKEVAEKGVTRTKGPN